MRLQNKVCIITGAGSGIGRASAIKFAEEGAIVAIGDYDINAANKVANEITNMGKIAMAYAVDVRSTEQIKTMVDDLLIKFKRIDVLINNAGIVKDAQLSKMTEDQFDQVIDINLKGAYNCAKAVVNQMIAQGSGVILNASSIVGIYGNFGQTNYAASKFGLIGFTKTWCKELAKKGIRINAVCPGFVNTPILHDMPEKVLQSMSERVPMRRLAEPIEIANVYAFLASDEASYINGATIEVSGGLSL